MKIIVDPRTEKFIASLDSAERAKAGRLRRLLEEFGPELRMPYSKKISKDLFELRGKGSVKIRIFYAFRFDCILVLHAFIKKTYKIPRQEIDIALHKLKLFDSI